MEYTRITLIFVFSVFLVTVVYSHTASAQCEVVGNTPGGGEEVVCTGNEPGNLTTTNLADLVDVRPNATVQQGVDLLDGDDTINLSGTIFDSGVGLGTGSGNDTINITGGSIVSTGDCINGSSDNDTIILNNAYLECGGQSAINGASDNDIVIVNNSELRSLNAPINTASGDDQITVGDNVVLIRQGGGDNINCGGGFDILTFAMTVPPNQVATLTAQLAAADPADGSITINGLFYEWTSCSVLVADFQEPEPRPIPTLSEWGLIAMAGTLGIFGAFYMMRRRQTT